MTGLEDVRAAQDRDFGAEGIAMYVVLVDETIDDDPDDPDGPDDPPARVVGRELLADRLEALRAEVAPSQRDDDLGLTATLLAAAAHADLRRRPGRAGS